MSASRQWRPQTSNIAPLVIIIADITQPQWGIRLFVVNRQDNRRASEITRLQTLAALSRLRVIESQLSFGLTLCALAETLIRCGQHTDARSIIGKVRRAAESIHVHIDEPNHLPRGSTADLRQQIAQLKTRTDKVESLLDKL